jgi:hypothetical protein
MIPVLPADGEGANSLNSPNASLKAESNRADLSSDFPTSTPRHTLQEWQQWYRSADVLGFEEPVLEAWDNRLAAQNLYFDMCVAKQTGHVHFVDEKSVAFLRADQGLAKPVIEKTVAGFISTGSWPALTHRECLHLIVRVQLARKVVAAILEATPQGMVVKSQMPDLGNREHAIRWFLIDLWNLGGEAFLAAMADDFFKKREQSEKAGKIKSHN